MIGMIKNLLNFLWRVAAEFVLPSNLDLGGNDNIGVTTPDTGSTAVLPVIPVPPPIIEPPDEPPIPVPRPKIPGFTVPVKIPTAVGIGKKRS